MNKQWRRMDLRRLHWLTVLAPAVALGLFELARRWWLEAYFYPWMTSLLVMGVTGVGSYIFSRWAFSIILEMDSQTKAQAERARALLQVAQTINSSLEVQVILQHTVDLACEHLGGDYGEVHYMKTTGEHGLRFSGLRDGKCTVRQRPTLRGLNGQVLRTGRPLRLADRHSHARTVPLPEGHPPIGPFLGVPIIVEDETKADILLIRAPGKEPFTPEDESFLLTVANQTAVAIENARLYDQVRHIAALEERDRIGREMHDGLAQTLGYLNLRIRAVTDLMAEGQHVAACAMLDDVRQVVKAAYKDVRWAIFDLRNGPDLDLGFVPALREYLREFSLQAQIEAELLLEGREPAWLLEVEVQLTRIIQEALTNVRKHALAERVWVHIETRGMSGRVIVEDNGVGFKGKVTPRPPGQPHFGLRTMHERAESIGGQLKVEPRPDGGTRVIVTIPTLERKVQTGAVV